MKLTGIFAPVPTPFLSGGSIDENGWRRNLRIWKASPLDGIVVCGSNGELPFITLEERTRLTEIAAEEAKGTLKIMTGAHFPSTRETISCARALAAAGAESVLLLPPHYYKGDKKAALRYFLDAADASPVPIFMYNMPANTGVDMDAEMILEAARHPNIIGIKDTSGNMTKMGYMTSRAPDSFSVFGGTGNYLLAALAMGACGGTTASSILYPATCQKILSAFKARDMDTAMELQARLTPVSDAITTKWGIPALKAALESRGMTGGPCRAPLLDASDEIRRGTLEILDASGLDKYETWR